MVSESELNAKAVAPRVTLAALEANIAYELYFTADQSCQAAGILDSPDSLRLLTFCILVLDNGFTVTGQSACASPENFDKEIGQRIAREDAIRQVWPLMGYELRSKLDRINKAGRTGDDGLGEALTRMLAVTLGNTEAFRQQDAEQILGHFTKDESEEGGVTK